MKYLSSLHKYTLERANLMEACRINWLADIEERLNDGLPFKEDTPEYKGQDFAEGEIIDMPECRNAAQQILKRVGSTDQFGLCDQCAKKVVEIFHVENDTEASPESGYCIGDNFDDENKYGPIARTDCGEEETRNWFRALVTHNMKATGNSAKVATRHEKRELEDFSNSLGTTHVRDHLAGYGPDNFVADCSATFVDQVTELAKERMVFPKLMEYRHWNRPASFKDQYSLKPIEFPHASEAMQKIQRAIDQRAVDLNRDEIVSTFSVWNPRLFERKMAGEINPTKPIITAQQKPSCPICEMGIKADVINMSVERKFTDECVMDVRLDLRLSWETMERISKIVQGHRSIFIGVPKT